MSKLQKVFESNESLTIRNFANTSGVTYHKLLYASKKPVEGEIYDPEKWNWTEMEKIITKADWERIDKIEWDKVQNTKKAAVVKDTTIFEVGQEWYLRRFGKVKIVYRNESYIVFLEEKSEQPKSWHVETWLINGPSREERK